MTVVCPCGSGLAYPACCGPLHDGAPAATPEALMRSRYSAFVQQNEAYLLSSWDEQTRPDSLELGPDTEWLGLQIHDANSSSSEGRVTFTARFRERGEWQLLHEVSSFRLSADGYWRYCNGEAQWQRLRPGRNDDCPCGSGRKFKKCCA